MSVKNGYIYSVPLLLRAAMFHTHTHTHTRWQEVSGPVLPAGLLPATACPYPLPPRTPALTTCCNIQRNAPARCSSVLQHMCLRQLPGTRNTPSIPKLLPFPPNPNRELVRSPQRARGGVLIPASSVLTLTLCHCSFIHAAASLMCTSLTLTLVCGKVLDPTIT